jgi:hypothetical protein
VALGVAPWLALLLWQPVAVGGMFLAVRSLVHSQLRARRARRAALVLALFGGSIGTFQDLWLPWWTWGYVFGVLSLATMVASLLLYDRAVRGAAPVWPAAVLAGLASWLHPWQGAVLGLTIVGAEIMVLTQAPGSPGGPRRRSRARPALGLVAISLPLAYYAVLGRADAAWRLAGESLRGGVPVWQVLLMLAPLLAPALLAYRIRPWSFAAAPYESGRRPRSLSTSRASTGSETSRCTPSSVSASRWRSSPHRAWAPFAGLSSRRDGPLWCSPCSHSPCPRP